jgi:hypothetical protein
MLAALTSAGCIASAAQAAGAVRVCVPKGEGRAIMTPIKGACKPGAVLATLAPGVKQAAEGKPGPQGTVGPEGKPGPEGRAGPQGVAGADGQSPFSAEETVTLKSILPYIAFEVAGIGGKPTIRFSGANIQVVNGAGHTESINGVGNLILGYDSEPGEQSGSHNLVLGFRQRYSSYGDILGGAGNSATGPFSTVFGAENTVSAPGSSVTGGYRNAASSSEAAVSGGSGNVASGSFSSVGGGSEGTAEGESSAVAGGFHNLAGGSSAVVSGGANGKAEGEQASIGGGLSNIASGPFSSILGGTEHTASTEFGHFP